MGLLTPLAIKVGAQPWMPRFLPQIVATDRFLHKATRGRFGLLSLAGLPQLFLTVKGRKSGVERTTPLLYVPHPSGHLIAGSNWGQPKAPVWIVNLRAAGTARVTINGRTETVRPREVEEPERSRLWEHMLQTWPNYAKYQERTDRQIPVFVLEPVADR